MLTHIGLTDSVGDFSDMLFYLLCCVLYCAVAIFFLAIRLPELASLVVYSITGAFLVILAVTSLVSLFISPSKTFAFMVRRFALITLVRFSVLLR